MKRLGLLAAVIFGFVICTGCSQVLDDESSPEPEETGLGLSVDFQGNTDVAGFEYAIYECGERSVVAGGIKDLEDLVLPGMIPGFEDMPFDARSRHLFSDFFTVLDAGCYDVEVEPVDKYGAAVEECSPASESNVEVLDGQTTEILLISQCTGPEKGALDVVAALNHPPELSSIKFSKFNRECERVKICASASDPDTDPIRFSWNQVAGPKLMEGISLISEKDDSCDAWYCDYLKEPTPDVYHQGEGRECIEFKLGKAGDYAFSLVVEDLKWDRDTNKMVPFDDSSASLLFPVYAADDPNSTCSPPKKGVYMD